MHDLLNENQKQVIEAHIWIRKNNMSIPDHILNTMRDAAIEAFRTVPVETEKLTIYHDDKNTPVLVHQIKEVLNRRYVMGRLTRYEVRNS